MDDADHAQRLIEAANDSAIAQVLCRGRGSASGSSICVVCGEPIEPARRAAYPNAVRCLDCQVAEERQQSRYG